MATDLYSVLGVSKSATQPEIKKAYREIARKYHPDKNPGDKRAENIFSSAAEAYRILGDIELRAQYDRHGRRAAETAARPAASPPVAENPADVFKEIFGTNSLFVFAASGLWINILLSIRVSDKSLYSFRRLGCCQLLRVHTHIHIIFC